MKKNKAILIIFTLISLIIFGCEGKPEKGPLKFQIVSPSLNQTLKYDFDLVLKGFTEKPLKSVTLKVGRNVISLPVKKIVKTWEKKWNIPINKLRNGRNILYVTVINVKNEKVRKSVRVNVRKPDPDAIAVKILTPSAGTLLKNNFKVKIKVFSAREVLFYWYRNPKTKKWKKLPKASAPSWTINISDFPNGEQYLEMTAYNGVKYARTARVKIIVQKPLPVARTIKVRIINPEKDDTLEKDFKLKLTVKSDFPVKKIWIKHKGTKNKWKPLSFTGTKYEWKLQIANFENGRQMIMISAYNGKEYGYARTFVKIKRNIPVDRGPGFGNCYKYAGDFGGRGNSESKFLKPYYIQISNDRKLYVTDSRRNKILVFDHKGKFLFSFGEKGSGAGQFDNPVGICIYKNEKIFVSDYLNRRVGIFNIKGKFIKFFYGKNMTDSGRFKLTGGVAVNNKGELFVVDFDAHRIFKFDTDGNFIKVFGKKGSGNGEMNNPTGITISLDGFLYITDKKNDRIVVFDRQGNFSFTFGNSGLGRGEFSRPMGIAVDKYNHIYVADTRNNRVVKFDHRGKYLCVVAKNLVNPIGIAIDNMTGYVYVVDRDASLIRMYKPCDR